MAVSRISTLSTAISNSTRLMDRAAATIARAGLEGDVALVDGSGAPTATAQGSDALGEGMVQMIVARSTFTASLRLADITNDMMLETLQLAGYAVDRG
jgi:hypothetical protein